MSAPTYDYAELAKMLREGDNPEYEPIAMPEWWSNDDDSPPTSSDQAKGPRGASR